jgi:hypothetical protein
MIADSVFAGFKRFNGRRGDFRRAAFQRRTGD